MTSPLRANLIGQCTHASRSDNGPHSGALASCIHCQHPCMHSLHCIAHSQATCLAYTTYTQTCTTTLRHACLALLRPLLGMYALYVLHCSLSGMFASHYTAHSQARLPRTTLPTLRHAYLALHCPLSGTLASHYTAHSQARLPRTTLPTLRHACLSLHCPFSGMLASHYTAHCLPRTASSTLRQALITPTAKLLGHDRVLYRTRSLL